MITLPGTTASSRPILDDTSSESFTSLIAAMFDGSTNYHVQDGLTTPNPQTCDAWIRTLARRTPDEPIRAGTLAWTMGEDITVASHAVESSKISGSAVVNFKPNATLDFDGAPPPLFRAMLLRCDVPTISMGSEIRIRVKYGIRSALPTSRDDGAGVQLYSGIDFYARAVRTFETLLPMPITTGKSLTTTGGGADVVFALLALQPATVRWRVTFPLIGSPTLARTLQRLGRDPTWIAVPNGDATFETLTSHP